jgi:hypothetical protein
MPNLADPKAQRTHRLSPRQELFCQAMAAGSGAAQAVRRAGYSPVGAKPRGHFLMGQSEIRIRVDRIRHHRAVTHQAELDKAASLMEMVITAAVEQGRLTLVKRAVEFRLKLIGVIQDRRIAHHYHGDHNADLTSPDADVEDLVPDPAEWLDGLDPDEVAAQCEAVSDPGPNGTVTFDDLSRVLESDPGEGNLGVDTAPDPSNSLSWEDVSARVQAAETVIKTVLAATIRSPHQVFPGTDKFSCAPPEARHQLSSIESGIE